jgi:hypothetical protein
VILTWKLPPVVDAIKYFSVKQTVFQIQLDPAREKGPAAGDAILLSPGIRDSDV